jgi:hypothetical protein
MAVAVSPQIGCCSEDRLLPGENQREGSGIRRGYVIQKAFHGAIGRHFSAIPFFLYLSCSQIVLEFFSRELFAILASISPGF